VENGRLYQSGRTFHFYLWNHALIPVTWNKPPYCNLQRNPYTIHR
jgi:hypothetical protein